MDNKHIKRHLPSLAIRIMQIENIMRYLGHIRMTIIKITENSKYWKGYIYIYKKKKLKLMCTVEIFYLLWKIVW